MIRRRQPDRFSPCPPAGFTLIELVVVLAMAGFVLAAGLPALFDASARVRTQAAAAEAVAIMQRARMTAVRSRTRVGILFRNPDGTPAGTTNGPWDRVTFTVYGDGDGDGVRRRDIDRGVDPQLQPTTALRRAGASVRLGFPPGPAPRDPGDPRRRLDRLADPVRFNRSDMIAFGPLGTATAGSLYFTDGKRTLVAVRVFGHTGMIRVLTYDPASEEWR